VKNLFIIHSEFQLLVTLSIIKQYHSKDDNSLILFYREQKTKSIKSLGKYFKHFLLIKDDEKTGIRIIPVIQRELNRLITIYRIRANSIIKSNYDNVFSPYPDAFMPSYIISCINNVENLINVNYLEEGSGFYYKSENIDSLIEKHNNKYRFYQFMKKFSFLRSLYNKNYNHNYGNLSKLDYANSVAIYSREFLIDGVIDKRITHPISNENIISTLLEVFKSVDGIFPESVSLLIVFDGENIYDPYEKNLIEAFFHNIDNYFGNSSLIIRSKKHPRYSNYLIPYSNKYFNLGNMYPAEFYFVNNYDRIVVIGGTSTALTISASLGIPTFSFIKLITTNDQKRRLSSILTYLENYNVNLVNSYSDLFDKMSKYFNQNK
jgi:hypothetical protein